jgi:hypothetical protein
VALSLGLTANTWKLSPTLIDFYSLRIGRINFLQLFKRRLPRLLSNHFPIILECGQLQKCKWPFRFENMWLKADGFMNRVRHWWLSYQFDGSLSYIFANKLKALKAYLKKWNTESFGNVGIKKNQLLYELHEIDRAAESCLLNFDEKLRKESLVTELEQTILLDEISWRQKSRVLWLKERDRNTQFFHQMANCNHRNNSISTLLIDGEMSTDSNDISKAII